VDGSPRGRQQAGKLARQPSFARARLSGDQDRARLAGFDCGFQSLECPATAGDRDRAIIATRILACFDPDILIAVHH
jgi:hypothetical protein